MKPTIKINFVDFWSNFNPNDNYFFNILSKRFNLVISDQPDYCFFSVHGYEHLKYDYCIKIFFTGENFFPDFNLCDYALGFHFLDIDDRYMRFPLYLIYDGFSDLKNIDSNFQNTTNRKFCNFVYSNALNADPLRNDFFHELSRYKKIDSGGRYINNVGGPVQNKITFIKDYKFTIAFENSCTLGYTTEKILEPMRVNSIPIYFGNPRVDLDFNPQSFIWIKDSKEVTKAIEEIIYLDTHEDAYLNKLKQPWQTSKQIETRWEDKLFSFFEPIFSLPLSEVKRIPKYGFTHEYTRELVSMNSARIKQIKIDNVKAKIKKVFKS